MGYDDDDLFVHITCRDTGSYFLFSFSLFFSCSLLFLFILGHTDKNINRSVRLSIDRSIVFEAIFTNLHAQNTSYSHFYLHVLFLVQCRCHRHFSFYYSTFIRSNYITFIEQKQANALPLSLSLARSFSFLPYLQSNNHTYLCSYVRAKCNVSLTA